MTGDEPSFIVTAELDDPNFRWLNGLRQQHFPAERNDLDAHLTLFHKLDAAAVRIVRRTVEAGSQAPIRLSFAGMRKLGRGVAVEVHSPELIALRAGCAAALADRLTPQDGQRFRPHVTIQNKVDSKIANDLYAALSANFVAREGSTGALQVWQYLGGPWRFSERLTLGVR